MSERMRTSELEEDAEYPETMPDKQDDESQEVSLPTSAQPRARLHARERNSTSRGGSSVARWSWTAEKTLVDWRKSTHGWPRVRKPRIELSKRSRILILGLCIFLLVSSLVGTPLYLVYHGEYERDLALAHQGMQKVETAGTLLKGLASNPFDSQAVTKAQQDFTAAANSFTQLNGDLQQLPGLATLLPHYGPLLKTAQKLAPIALELSQAGGIVCNTLSVVIDRLRNPLSSQSQGITTADLQTMSQNFTLFQQLFNQATGQINQIPSGDLAQLDPRLVSAVQLFHTALPQIQAAFQSIQTVLTVAPLILGIGSPTTYLVEMLDSTELRPGGGFIGSYGTLTIAGARLSSLHITDVDLLDKPFAMAGNFIPVPSTYSWFPWQTSWGLRDTNLDADFPTASKYGEQIYHMEGGTADVQGVVAITPWLIQDMLKITGPIAVPEYQETITADNLIDRIHYHQLAAEEGQDYIPDPNGHSSLRKRFTEILFEHFLARVQQLASTSAMPKFARLFLDALHTKDIQVYFNNDTAESLLSQYHLANTIAAPPTGDSLMPVDANIIANKANYFIATSIQDQVTLDESGNATHHTVLTYTWPIKPGGDVAYGHERKDSYLDYVRLYVPPGSKLGSLQGLQQQSTSTTFGREVWSGFLQFQYGDTISVTVDWTLPNAATKDATGWHYQDVIERPAGITWQLNFQLTLPSCAKDVGQVSGFTSQNQQHASVKQPLTTDLTLGINYTC